MRANRHWKTALTSIALIVIGLLARLPNLSRAQSPVREAIGGTATPPFAGADSFIHRNCAGCHNSSTPAARLDLIKLGYDPSNSDNFATWVKVHDRVSAGEMPPPGMPRPPAESLKQFVNGLSNALTAYERTVATERGRAGLR